MNTSRPAGFNLGDAITNALDDALTEDPRTIVFGEDVGQLGGVFRITRGLQQRHGPDRVFDTPLGEAGIAGVAVGMALNGLRPVIEIQFDGFILPALNQLFGHLAKFPARIAEPGAMPVVVRVPVGGRIRAAEFHSESPEAYFCHTPDLRVIAASTAETARSLLLAAIRSDEPCIFLEPKRLYRRGRVAPETELADVDFSRARTLRDGEDVLLIAWGPSVPLAIEAAEALAAEGKEACVLDLVSLAPLDEVAIVEAAARIGRAVIVSEEIQRCSLASEVAALVACGAFADLRAPVRIVAAPNRPIPAASREHSYFPSLDDVLAAVKETSR